MTLGSLDVEEGMGERSQPQAGELEELIRPLLGRAAAYALALVRNREDAEDAVQEATVKAYLGFGRHDRSRSFKAWWFAIVRNCCLELLRKRRRRPPAASIDPAGLPSREQELWEEFEGREALNSALDQLSPVQREVIQLRYFGDCSYQDIAATLAIPRGTVMSRLHAARQALLATYRKDIR